MQLIFEIQASAKSLIVQWQNLSVGPEGNLMSIFGVQDSWALMYNLYPDQWLGLNLVDQGVRTMNLL
jgi:hypothetical protein